MIGIININAALSFADSVHDENVKRPSYASVHFWPLTKSNSSCTFKTRKTLDVIVVYSLGSG